MKALKIYSSAALVVVAALIFQSCHTKKLLTKPAPVVQQAPPPAPAPKPAPAPVQAPPPAPKPNLNFTNVQFDFNSAVLRTDGIQYLDYVVSQLKLAPAAQFTINGYASAEGTAAHNMELSVDRANAVKQYLINGGISSSVLTAKGYGTRHPIASNKTEEGKEKNRRVEIKPVQ
jgi:OmpA-OmpF porin, OOP family